MKRRSFSLVECLIALSLLTIMLTGFSALFWQYSTFETTMQDKMKRYSSLQMRISRLQDLLARAVYDFGGKYSFYTVQHESKYEKGTSLVFTFDAGVDIDPTFSNVNIGKLFLDTEGNLEFAYWPDPSLFPTDTPLMKKERLFTNVTSFSMRFFSCKVAPPSTETTKKPPQGIWLDAWDVAYNVQPQLIEITLQLEPSDDVDAPKKLIFPCLIPRGFPLIEYG